MANQEYLEARGRLRVIAAERATITVGTDAVHFQVCQITFGKDGSIFVQCPYFPGRNGILSSPPQDPDATGPITYDLRARGKLTSHLVKLSHHPDGNVHFSQDGKILTAVRRKTFPLSTMIGHVFQLHIYHPTGFEELKATKSGRAYLPFVFRPELPPAITLFAEWRRRRAIEANTDPPDGTAGPVTEITSRTSRATFTVFFLAQPAGFPLRDHVLLVGAETTQPLENLKGPTMVLMGGFDPHEVTEPGQKVQHTGLLAWLYPCVPNEDMLRRIGSVDVDAQPRM